MRDEQMATDLRNLRMTITTATTRMAVAVSLGDSEDFVDEIDTLTKSLATLKAKYAERQKKAKKGKRFR